MRVLLATDAEWIADEVIAAIGGPDVSFTVCSEGRQVARVVADRPVDEPYDIGILDLQVGSMGGIAVTMALRLDESAGALPHVRLLVLLDRVADVHLARRCGAEGWIIKPLDPLRLRRAVAAITAGGTYVEGVQASVPASTADAEPAPTG